MKAVFIFAVNQNVAKFEILNGYDGRAVIQNILQRLFAGAQLFLCASAFADLSQ
jgi:hypothetical protein